LDIAVGLIAGFNEGSDQKQQRASSVTPSSAANGPRHSLEKMPHTYARRCVWCAKIDRKTKLKHPEVSKFGCKSCNINLCKTRSCYTEFHSGDWLSVDSDTTSEDDSDTTSEDGDEEEDYRKFLQQLQSE
jgi:hypothetical protein